MPYCLRGRCPVKGGGPSTRHGAGRCRGIKRGTTGRRFDFGGRLGPDFVDGGLGTNAGGQIAVRQGLAEFVEVVLADRLRQPVVGVVVVRVGEQPVEGLLLCQALVSLGSIRIYAFFDPG